MWLIQELKQYLVLDEDAAEEVQEESLDRLYEAVDESSSSSSSSSSVHATCFIFEWSNYSTSNANIGSTYAWSGKEKEEAKEGDI